MLLIYLKVIKCCEYCVEENHLLMKKKKDECTYIYIYIYIYIPKKPETADPSYKLYLMDLQDDSA